MIKKSNLSFQFSVWINIDSSVQLTVMRMSIRSGDIAFSIFPKSYIHTSSDPDAMRDGPARESRFSEAATTILDCVRLPSRNRGETNDRSLYC